MKFNQPHIWTPSIDARGSLSAGLFALALVASSSSVGCDDAELFTTAERVPDAELTQLEPEASPFDDRSIEAAVTRQLSAIELTPAFELEVDSRDGIVELRGEVDNMLAEQSAVERTRAVRGVRSVIDRIEVAAEPVPDEQLREDVRAALLYDPVTESYEVDLKVDAGHVTLEGEVDSWTERHLVERVTSSVRGVREIDNQLTLELREARDDGEIAREVLARLTNDVYIDVRDIGMEVLDGRVVLSGAVGSVAERSRAWSRAWVRGVQEVDVEALEVDWRELDFDIREPGFELRSNREIRAALLAAIELDPRQASSELEVEIIGGVVTLRGTVTNLAAQHALEQLAQHTLGVVAVNNETRVVPQLQPSDAQIAGSIIRRLRTNVLTSVREVDVDVDQGVVTLRGTVDGYREQREAATTASLAPGVLFVNNLLRVAQPDASSTDAPQPRYLPYSPYTRISAPPVVQGSPSDENIETAIETQLLWDPFVDSSRVRVSVEDGVAVLTGTVDSHLQLRSVTRDAYDGGALAVENLISLDI